MSEFRDRMLEGNPDGKELGRRLSSFIGAMVAFSDAREDAKEAAREKIHGKRIALTMESDPRVPRWCPQCRSAYDLERDMEPWQLGNVGGIIRCADCHWRVPIYRQEALSFLPDPLDFHTPPVVEGPCAGRHYWMPEDNGIRECRLCGRQER